MIQIDHILRKIQDRGQLQGIKRYRYPDYDLEGTLQAIEAIGKARSPKFVIDDENRFTYENILRWMYADPAAQCLDPETKRAVPANPKAGIYIAGNTGSGKSWALEILSAFAAVAGIAIHIAGEDRQLYWDNFRAETLCDEYRQTGTLAKYKQRQILGIQDLAAESTETLHMGNRINVLKQLVEYRGDRTDLITLITSNIPISHKRIAELYGDRVTSRLAEMCNYYEIKGRDRRMQ